MIPIAVFASGRGSNFEAIHDAIVQGRLDAGIRLVISDKPGAPVLEKARSRGLKALCIEPQKGRKEEHERRILEELGRESVGFLVMAGYMRILGPTLIGAYRSERGYSRIVNIHPSLLPAFPGIGGYRQAFEYGAKIAGVSVHLVEDEVDAGPLCAQEAFGIAECRNAEEVEKLGLAVEHRVFPETLKWVLPERFSVEHRGEGPDRGGPRRICVRAD